MWVFYYYSALIIWTDVKTDISELSHIDTTWGSAKCTFKQRKTERGGGRHQGGVCLQMMSEWKRKLLSTHSRETETESLTATSSYRRLDRSSHWLNISQSKCFYSIWTCLWSVRYGVCESAEAQADANLFRSDVECVLWCSGVKFHS